jgi:hypothetical protein
MDNEQTNTAPPADPVRAYLKEIGARGGRVKTGRKLRSVRRNLARARAKRWLKPRPEPVEAQ